MESGRSGRNGAVRWQEVRPFRLKPNPPPFGVGEADPVKKGVMSAEGE